VFLDILVHIFNLTTRVIGRIFGGVVSIYEFITVALREVAHQIVETLKPFTNFVSGLPDVSLEGFKHVADMTIGDPTIAFLEWLKSVYNTVTSLPKNCFLGTLRLLENCILNPVIWILDQFLISIPLLNFLSFLESSIINSWPPTRDSVNAVIAVISSVTKLLLSQYTDLPSRTVWIIVGSQILLLGFVAWFVSRTITDVRDEPVLDDDKPTTSEILDGVQTSQSAEPKKE